MDRQGFSNMDFEYTNGVGPVDERSPFAQIGRNSQRNNSNNNDKKRSFAVFGSPNKTTFPSLREPASQPHFFSSPKPLPALPPNRWSNNPLFNTPRKLDVDDFASSGGETPKSPERNDVDSDATPDMSLRSKFSNLDTMTKPSLLSTKSAPVFTAGGKKEKDRESPSRRQSWWKSTKELMGASPRSKDDYAHGAERKIMKRRSKEQKALIPRRDSVSDSEPEQKPRQVSRSRKVSGNQDKSLAQPAESLQVPPPPPPPMSQDTNKKHWTLTFFEFITAHPTLPHVLSFYAQLFLNLFLIGSIMYILYSFWATIRGDVDKKTSIAVAEVLSQMAACARDYNANRCDPATRAPVLENACNNWELCMNQNPHAIGRARISAHAFAEIFNSFIEPISYKAMLFTVLLIFGTIAFSNLAFSIFRDKAAERASAQHHHYYAGVPPTPQPQHSYNAALDWGNNNNNPYQQGQQLGLEPAPSQYAGGDRETSPVRRLQFR
ncbi:hypothetical protein D6D29_02692 [Aureobasidium pullulans]|nr:hypothetical protein D6D29_02692 [Aureobasidium pullulans]THW68440.1 hypothetical protein D6D25_01415 [Aureobasidium pullulans]THY09128.1 hypothetical protein D6D03_00563 [Aureobasidium pullulans]